MQCGLQPNGLCPDRARLHELYFLKVKRLSLQGFENEFDITGRRHDGGRLHPVISQVGNNPV